MIRWILKQQYISPVIGHAKLSATYTAMYLNFLTNMYAAMVLYTTTIDKHMYAKLGWSIGILPFMGCLILSYILLALLVRKFEMASTMGVNMDQQLGFSRKWYNYEKKIDQILKLLGDKPNRRQRKELRYGYTQSS